ncbi:MAG: hypothetical protein MUE73_09705 [Planctomycetes bacterium]|jgi:hypothetical protein|nr:hypothetical protein [Planctomycetota bacterium]
MNRSILAFLLAAGLGSGCSMVSRTEVETGFNPAAVPHRVVAAPAQGSDGGFRLLGLIPFSFATPEGALADAYRRAGLTPTDRLVVTEARFLSASVFYLLFSVQSVDVEARIVELTAPR